MLYQVSAVLYVLWGVLHIGAAADAWRLAAGQPAGPVRARLRQNAWTLLCAAICVTAIAVTMNWTNDVLGYWINAVLSSLIDIGFIVFVLASGHARVFPGALGPLLWLLALATSSLAQFSQLTL